MYDNIGGKIKTLAQLTFAVLTTSSLVISLINFVQEFYDIGVILLLTVPLFAWILSLLLYGFGELIEKTTEIAENTRPNKGNTTEANENFEQNKEANPNEEVAKQKQEIIDNL